MWVFVLGVISCIIGVSLTAFHMFIQSGYIGSIGLVLFWAGFLMILASYSTTKNDNKHRKYKY